MILYICNGKKCDCAKTICCYTTNIGDRCFHTTNPDFALNGPLKEESVTLANIKEERPLFVSDDEGNIWEGFVGIGRFVDCISNKGGKII